MAFVQKTWKDRVAEYINRRILTKEDGTTELVSVERSEGTISQEGDAFSAENMNDLEQRIANEFSEQNKKLDKEWTYVTASNNQTLNIDLSKIEYIGVGGLINNELDNTTIIPVSVFKALGRTLQIFGYANGVLFTAGVAKVSDTSVKVSVSQFAGGACVIYK